MKGSKSEQAPTHFHEDNILIYDDRIFDIDRSNVNQLCLIFSFFLYNTFKPSLLKLKLSKMSTRMF